MQFLTDTFIIGSHSYVKIAHTQLQLGIFLTISVQCDPNVDVCSMSYGRMVFGLQCFSRDPNVVIRISHPITVNIMTYEAMLTYK